jgi:hypothetical protein
MDAPLREVGGDFVPATTPQAPQAPTSAVCATRSIIDCNTAACESEHR